ncbi:MAG: hypothetical protein JW913_19860 [Chitinispirillaceae bacterium]|nr:hypothetical protein [Chitinispirillaceae bacterium]
MLETLFGSINRERVLLFIHARNEGYAREIARYFSTDLDPVQKQLERLEFGRVLASRSAGRTRLYLMNPQYPFLNELRILLDKALTFYTPEEREALINIRRRPRRKNKPL